MPGFLFGLPRSLIPGRHAALVFEVATPSARTKPPEPVRFRGLKW